MCETCGSDCLESHADKCILYTGESSDKLGITKGMYYNGVTTQLIEELEKICNERVELKCLYSNECNSCEPSVTIPVGVQILIDKICALSATDIKYEGDKYCIGKDSISGGAISLLGRGFNYEVQPTDRGTSISYNLDDVTKSLPANYQVGRISTVVSGKPLRGKSIIVDSNKSTLGATVSNDRFPLNIDIDMRVATPTGDVKMVKSLHIASPLAGTYSAQMNVQDFGAGVSEEYSLEGFLEAMAAQICANKSELDSLKNIDLVGCEDITYTSTDIRDIIAQHGSVLCQILKRLDDLETVSYNTCGGDSCNKTSKSNTPEGAINELSTTTCDLQGQCDALRRDVQTLSEISSTNCNQSGFGGITKNGSTTGGTCSGAGCSGGTSTCVGGLCGGTTPDKTPTGGIIQG